MMPIGMLGISMDGRTGSRKPLQGHVSIPGLDSAVLSHVTAVDSLSRNFVVDLSVLSHSGKSLSVDHIQTATVNQSWSSKFVAGAGLQDDRWHMSSRGADYSVGTTVPLSVLNPEWSISISKTEVAGSPWMSFSGVFGTVDRSSILETSLNKTWKNGYWAQLGTMQTVTSITPGLVTSVDPIWSVHAVAGWSNQNWNVYTGIQPTVVKGSVNIQLPDSVDHTGQLHYRNHQVSVRNQAVGFAGVGYTKKFSNHMFTAGAVINQQGQYNAKINYLLKF
jgi:hypothetical protein